MHIVLLWLCWHSQQAKWWGWLGVGLTQITKTLGSRISIRYWSNAKLLDQCLINVDLGVFGIWGGVWVGIVLCCVVLSGEVCGWVLCCVVLSGEVCGWVLCCVVLCGAVWGGVAEWGLGGVGWCGGGGWYTGIEGWGMSMQYKQVLVFHRDDFNDLRH